MSPPSTRRISNLMKEQSIIVHTDITEMLDNPKNVSLSNCKQMKHKASTKKSHKDPIKKFRTEKYND